MASKEPGTEVRIEVRIREDDADWLRDEARRLDLTTAQVIRMYVRERVDWEKVKRHREEVPEFLTTAEKYPSSLSKSAK